VNVSVRLKGPPLEESEPRKPDRRREVPPAVALNFRENPLRQPGNRRRKQQIPVKNLGKGHKRGLTGNQKGAKVPRLQRDLRNRSKGIESST